MTEGEFVVRMDKLERERDAALARAREADRMAAGWKLAAYAHAERAREAEAALALVPHDGKFCATNQPVSGPCDCYVSNLPARAKRVREVVEAVARYAEMCDKAPDEPLSLAERAVEEILEAYRGLLRW